MEISEVRVFQAEGTARIKAQRWECTCNIEGKDGGQSGWTSMIAAEVMKNVSNLTQWLLP